MIWKIQKEKENIKVKEKDEPDDDIFFDVSPHLMTLMPIFTAHYKYILAFE